MISRVGVLVLYGSLIGAMESWDTIVGLDCQVKYHLKKQHIPVQDSPFDCIEATAESVLKMFKHQFEGFLERQNVRLPHGESVFDVHYKVTLMGPLVDIPFIIDLVDVKRWLKLKDAESTGFAKIKAIHDERVQKLLTLLKSDKRILFIRKGITKAQVIRLDALLQKLYPDLTYGIVALGEDGSYIDDWGFPRIRSFYLGPLDYTIWSANDFAWQKVFEKLGLMPQGSDQ